MLLLGVLPACTEASEADSAPQPIPSTLTGAAGSVATPPTRDLVFTAEPGPGRPVLERAVARWARATGRALTIGEHGVLVRFEPLAHMGTRPVCGVTHSQLSSGPLDITISAAPPPALGCRDLESVTTHEVGHALCDHLAGDPALCHSAHGVMAAPSWDLSISAEVLERVCLYATCPAFEPEPADE